MIVVDLPDELLKRCDDHARRVTSGAYEKKNPASAAVSWGDAQTNSLLWMESKMAECAACIHLDVDPIAGLNWKDRADKGWDFIYPHAHGGQPRVDVKDTKTRTLFWPVNKNHLLASAKFDILLSATARRDFGCVLLRGWLSKTEFMQRMVASSGLEGEPREPETLYVPHERLHRMGIFPGHSDDEREHCCWCGEWGAYGFGVALRDGNLGNWYCRQHRPVSCETSSMRSKP